MNERNNTAWRMGLSLLTGILVGGTAGVLYAPQSGARTRRQLANLAEDVRERAGQITEETAEAIEKLVERSRRFVAV